VGGGISSALPSGHQYHGCRAPGLPCEVTIGARHKVQIRNLAEQSMNEGDVMTGVEREGGVHHG
jgi:hypothetical protein